MPDGGAALVISLDFELHWGVQDIWSVDDYRANLLGARAAVPAMLALFRDYGVHATWAVVGLLFFESKREMLDGLPARRPAYRVPNLSPYRIFAGIGTDETDDPFHFAPSLIRRIADTPHQEIGTHTFAHYYCLEAGQSTEDFRADLEAAIRVTRRKLGHVPRSIVFPRDQISREHLAVCDQLGFVAYRGTPDAWAYRPRARADESVLRRAVRLADAYLPLVATDAETRRFEVGRPADVPASRYLRAFTAPLRPLEPLRVRRIVADLRRAASRGRVYHLWWHPHDFGRHLDENLRVLRRILDTFAGLRERHGMESLTMAEAAARHGALLRRACAPGACAPGVPA